MRKLRLGGHAYVGLAAALWALSGVVAKHLFASRTMEPVVLVEFRMLLGCALLAAVLVLSDPAALRVRRADWTYFLVYGSLGMAAVQLTYFTAVSESNVSTAIFLQYLAPLLTAVYAVTWLRQPPPPGLARTLLVAVAGSALLLLGGGRGLTASPLGVMAGLASAGFLSFNALYGARGVSRYRPTTVLLYGLGVGAACLWPLFQPWRVAELGLQSVDWLFLLYMAVLGTLVPFWLFLTGLRHVSAVQATLTAMLEPALATLGAWLLLGETLTPLQTLGCLMIGAAVAGLQLARARTTAPLGSNGEV